MEDRSEHLNFASVIQSIALIVLEAFLTFLLKSDRQSKKLAQNLIHQQALVELRTTFPSTVVFVTFTSRGVLLDAKQPERHIDAVITATFKDMAYGFFTAPASSLRKIKIDGPIELIDELRILMSSFNLQQIINHWVQSDWFKSILVPSKDVDEDGEPISHGRSSRSQRTLIKKLNEQQLLVDQMNLQTKEQLYVIAKLHKRMKLLITIGFILLACLAAGLAGTLIYFLH
jgi:heme/copper-type cytochrome/quinol oxidase subunit 2